MEGIIQTALHFNLIYYSYLVNKERSCVGVKCSINHHRLTLLWRRLRTNWTFPSFRIYKKQLRGLWD